jgi:membrane dipeptidase
MTNLGKIFFKKENILIGGAIFVVLATVLGLAIGIPLSQSKTSSLSKANTLLENNVLIDGHNDLPQLVRGSLQNQFARFDFNDMKLIINGTTHTDLKRLKEGKLGAQFWVAYAGCQSLAKDAARLHLEQIDMIKRLVMKYPDYLEFVTSSAGIKTAFKNKKIASLVGVESGHAIDSSLALLRIFYEVGARYMTLTHNCNVPWLVFS